MCLPGWALAMLDPVRRYSASLQGGEHATRTTTDPATLSRRNPLSSGSHWQQRIVALTVWPNPPPFVGLERSDRPRARGLPKVLTELLRDTASGPTDEGD